MASQPDNRSHVRIELWPVGKELCVTRDTSLRDVLFSQGLEFPCGGRGRCKGCRIKVLEGTLPVTAEDARLLSRAELCEGWRLACRARACADVTIELAQWEMAILSDESAFSFVPREGLGAAVDLGTTTLAAQLLDLRTGHVLAVRTALNEQAVHGADIMSRLDYAMRLEGGSTLQEVIRRQIGRLIGDLLEETGDRKAELEQVVIVGNTAMHHLFCGLSVGPLAQHPFESPACGLQTFSSDDLDWRLASRAAVQFLPCLAGFVGSDVLAGIVATNLHRSEELVALIDLGTNGEMVVGNQDRLLCASTAAGPAFEGARIGMGMRATTGAICSVNLTGGQMECRVLGNADPRGICGSGLVDAIAAGLDLHWIQSSGRLASGCSFTVMPPVVVTQGDVREVQLAKGAIAAGLRILTERWGASVDDLHRIYLAGAFGNYMNRTSARRIGLLRCRAEQVEPVGNSALLGAKLVLCNPEKARADFDEIRGKTEHVSLNEHVEFQEIFGDEMRFPERQLP